MQTNRLVSLAIKARERFEWSFLIGNPDYIINRYERAYSKALDKLSPSEREYVSLYEDCQPDS